MKDGRYTSEIWFYLRWTRTGHRYGIVIPKVAPVSLSNTYVRLLLHDIFSGLSFFDIDRFLVGQKEPQFDFSSPLRYVIYMKDCRQCVCPLP